MKKILTLAFFSFIIILSINAQGTESFTNSNAPGNTYTSGNYTGDNGDTWTYNGARTPSSTYQITGNSLGFGSSGTRNISSNSGAGGVGDLSFSIRSYFTGGNASNRTIEAFVNGVSQGSFTLTAMNMVENYTIMGINITGNVVIQFVSTGSRQIVMDDVVWTAALIPAPVELTSFTAIVNNKEVALDWNTASELNNSHFDIEYSTDGTNFRAIGEVAGHGTTQEKQAYNYTHTTPSNGANYYRLKQVDFDGAFEYSEIRVVELERTGKIVINPSAAIAEITVSLTEITGDNNVIGVYDMVGRTVMMSNFDGALNVKTLDISNLQKGYYVVRVQAGNEIFTERFMKMVD